MNLLENLKEKPNIFEENLKRLSLKNNNILKSKNRNSSYRNSVNSVNIKKLNDDKANDKRSVDIRQINSNLNIHNSSLFLNEDNIIFNLNRSGKNSLSKSNSKFYHQFKRSAAIINSNNIRNINLLQSNKNKGNLNLGKNEKINRVATNNSRNLICLYLK